MQRELLQPADQAAFSHCPIVPSYTSADSEKHLGIKGAKVVWFEKSGLAGSLYAELKQYRITKPPRAKNVH